MSAAECQNRDRGPDHDTGRLAPKLAGDAGDESACIPDLERVSRPTDDSART